MTFASTAHLKQQLTNHLSEHLSDRLSREEYGQVRLLLDFYYQHVPAADLLGETLSDLTGGLVAHWQLARRRAPGEAKVRVYNPNFEEHGWQSRYTIVEIVAEDMAFLVNSISMAINNAGLTIALTIHPVCRCTRDDQGELLQVSPRTAKDGDPESMIRFYVDKRIDALELQTLEGQIHSVIGDVAHTNRDWATMQQRVQDIRNDLEGAALPIEQSEFDESLAFLDWIEINHFTFIAYCSCRSDGSNGGAELHIDRESMLGIFRDAVQGEQRARQAIPVFGIPLDSVESLLLITKSNARSTVHRPAYMDFVGIRRFDEAGRATGIDCFLGLFTSTAYSSLPDQIPIIRNKLADVMSDAGFSPHGHSGKQLSNVLINFPRDELFQVSTQELSDIALGITGLQERQRTRLFVIRDTFDRFYSCLVYLPRERYNRDLRLKVQELLMEAFAGVEVESNVQLSESILAQLHFVIHRIPGAPCDEDLPGLETRIADATLTWGDRLREALVEKFDEVLAFRYFNEYRTAFPNGYMDDFHPRTAVADIARIEATRAHRRLAIHVYRPILEKTDQIHFRLYAIGTPVSLSEAIPVLENLGLTVIGEHPYRIKHPEEDIWIHDFAARLRAGIGNLSERTSSLLQETFVKIWSGEADNDGFNQLVLAAGYSWRQAVLIRAYSQYLQQIRMPFSQAYIVKSLATYPQIATQLVEFFSARFNPVGRTHKPEAIRQALEASLDEVSSLDQDRILRSLINLIEATLRTNFFQTDAGGAAKPYVSFKLDPRQVTGMPAPKPMYEIFVFSSRMEGVHLRGGPVARGGLRWSDRMEDYRTEVLGLVKAQMVKNAVIVPVGSKGGFIVKRPPQTDDRSKVMEEVVACYKTLLRGMLDLTDNLIDAKLVPPRLVKRYDGDDPYLVVAADKGTATFSDIANSVSAEYGFWLGDAFASGGSAGYDHKKMGITARGAWESVKRSFRELGRDIQTTSFTVVGIGDMSGDVFGNGMLLSRHIKLLAAFNHLHIFLDPSPDPESSFHERARLFDLPRSSWLDYDKRLISQGGGVYSRSAKAVPITAEVAQWLNIKASHLTPNELIHLLLKAPADLLWNGGIGTYVKASTETNEEARDKVNDVVRVDADELRCKVIGEGGNLGVTQLARIEFASRGGLVYTDAIDNSAGVDCSDHEVNIKILLGQVASSGDITDKQRNELLEEMTDEVAQLVLRNNYTQTQIISIIASRAPQKLYEHARFIELMEQKGLLDRELELLPTKKQINERQADNRGLTKPEISVLLSYSKMVYFDALLNSDIPDDEFLTGELRDYFPKVLGARYATEMRSHRLRREIIATRIANDIVDHLGPGIGFRIREEVGSDVGGVARAYIAVREIFSTRALVQQIESLDCSVPAQLQIDMMHRVAAFLERALTAVLRPRRIGFDMKRVVDMYQHGVMAFLQGIPQLLGANERLELNRDVKRFTAAGVPKEVAQQVASLVPLSCALDIVEIGRLTGKELNAVAPLYFHLGSSFELLWLRNAVSQLGVRTHWHNIAKKKLLQILDDNQRGLTAHILETTKPFKKTRKMYEQWAEQNQLVSDRYNQMIAELKAMPSLDFPTLAVAVNSVGELLST